MKNKKTKDNFFSIFIRSLSRMGLKKDVYFFIESLSSLLEAGMDLVTALGAISGESKNKRIFKIVTRIKEKVENGSSFTETLRELNVLPKHMIAFVYLGEESGKLVENLKILVLQNEKEVAFKSKSRSALLYAIIVISLTLIVGIGTGWYTLPKIAGIYVGMDAELPFLTKVIIDLGIFLSDYGYVFVPLFVFFWLALFYFFFSFPKTRFIGHWFLMKLPMIKNLIKEVEISRFAYLLANMLEAGLPINQALEATPDITTFSNYKKFYRYLYDKIEEGNSFEYCFTKYKKIDKLYSSSTRQMIVAAEKAGTLPQTLMRIGKMYEQKVEATSKNLPVILEPILLIIVGLGVAIFVLGTIMPIYNLVNLI